jgi:hypothetical protein
MSLTEALEVTLRTDRQFKDDENAALVSLCRLLAEQIDEAKDMGKTPSSHVSAAYLSALKDLRRLKESERRSGDGGSKLGNLRSVHAQSA